MSSKWHASSLSEIEQALKTDVKNGLSMRQARTRLEKELKKKNGKRKYLFACARPSVIKCVAGAFADPSMICLLVVSLLSVIFGESAQGLLTLTVAVVCCAISATMSYISEKRLARASDYSSPLVRVVRGGDKYYTDGRNAVVGDVIELTCGDIIPCDARIISCRDLEVKEIINTASGIKNRTVSKTCEVRYSPNDATQAPNAQNMLYAGTAILAGTALAVVTATGDDVYLSRYVADGGLARNDAQMSFERQLKPLLQRIRLASICAVVVLVLLSLLTVRNGSVIDSFLLVISSVVLVSVQTLTVGMRYLSSAYISRLLGSNKRQSKRKANLCAAIKNPAVLDKLSELSALIIVGKAGLTQGDYRVRSVYTADGMIDSLSSQTVQGNRILTFMYTYIKALEYNRDENDAVSGDISEALLECVRTGNFDCGAADIFLRSLYYVNDGTRGYACAETADYEFRVAMTLDDDVLDYCKLVRRSDEQVELTERDAEKARAFSEKQQLTGAKCLYIVSERSGVATLEGVIAIEQAAVEGFEWTVSELEKLGIKTRIFLNCEDDVSLINELGISKRCEGRIAYASSVPFADAISSYRDYDVFLGFSADEYLAIAEKMQRDGERVAVYSIDNSNNALLSKADVAVSCDTLKYDSDKYKASAYSKLSSCGDDSSVRCTSQTRLFSGVIVKRAHANGGGVAAFLNAVKIASVTHLSLCSALELCALLISATLPFALLSIALGTTFISAFQMLSICAVATFLPFVLFIESDYKTELLTLANRSQRQPIYLLLSRLPSVISRLMASSASAIITAIAGLLGLFGETPSYSIPIFVSLLFTLFIEVLVIHADRTQRGEGRSARLLKVIMVYASMLLVCGISTHDYFAATLYPHGMGTLEFLVVPIYLILYVGAVLISRVIERKRNKA